MTEPLKELGDHWPLLSLSLAATVQERRATLETRGETEKKRPLLFQKAPENTWKLPFRNQMRILSRDVIRYPKGGRKSKLIPVLEKRGPLSSPLFGQGAFHRLPGMLFPRRQQRGGGYQSVLSERVRVGCGGLPEPHITDPERATLPSTMHIVKFLLAVCPRERAVAL